MHPSLSVRSRAHQPLIKFLGKRIFPSSPTQPHAHPAAPAEVKERFPESVKQPVSTPATNLGSNLVFPNFWEAPERFWRKEIEDVEIDAILSGGASLH